MKVWIQKIINLGWIRVQKSKLTTRTPKVYEVKDKPNLDEISKSYLIYVFFLIIWKDYKKKVVCNDSTTWLTYIFVTFIFTKT